TDQRDAARLVYEALLARARERGDPGAETVALIRLSTLAGQTMDRVTEARALLERARATATASGDPAVVAETEWNLAQTACYGGEPAAACAHGERALALARLLEQPEAVARCLNQLALVGRLWGDWSVAEQRAMEARRLYASLGDRAMEADSLILAAGMLTGT